MNIGQLGSAPTNHRPVHLLWTSGWDSTYRLLQHLNDTSAVIQPWYVLDESRRSLGTEIRAMGAIRDAIRERDPEWAERILPTQFRSRAEIPADQDTTAMYERLKRRVRAGPQYEWLARLSKAEALEDLELCIENRPEGICALLAANARRVEASDRGMVRLVEHPGDPDLELFRRFSFPLLDQTKLDMERSARQSGFADLMERTWFCFRPRNGRPCGRCHPCQVVIKEGMGRRIPPSNRFRGRLRLLRRALAKPLRGY